jgi:TadE-like protein
VSVACCTISFSYIGEIVTAKSRYSFFRCFWRDRQGVAFLELTLLFPLLLALSLGVFEFGRGLQHYHAVNKAARDAARYLARVPATCPSAGTGNGTVAANFQTNARNLALTGQISGGTPIISYWTNPSTIAISVDCIDRTSQTPALRGADFIPVMHVLATVPYGDLGFLTILGLSGFSFRVEHGQLHIGE